MKSFFMKKSDEQKFDIFKLILFSKNGLSVNMIAEKSNLSLNLIYRKIKALRDDLKEIFPHEEVSLIKNDIFFTAQIGNPINISFVIDSLRLYYIQHSHEYLIFHSVSLKYYDSVESLSQKINLSVAQTYKSLNAINRALGYFQLKLSFSREKSQSNFHGSEINIRLFLFYYYWSVFKGLVWPFRKSLENLKNINIAIDDLSGSQKTRLNYYQTLTIWRVIYRNKLVVIEPDFLAVIQLLNTVHPIKFALDLNLSEEALVHEESYFAYLCRIFIFDVDTISQKIETAEAFIQSDLPISKSCTFILDGLYAAYNIDPKREDYLFSYHSILLALISITYIKIDNSELFENDQNLSNLGTDFADFPQMEAELSELAEKLFSEAPYLDNLTSKGFFTYMVFLFYFILDCSKKSQQLKVFVQYSKNHVTTEEIKKSLAGFFNNDVIVFVSNLKQSDILISDCYEQDYPSDNFFYFDNPLDTTEWQALISYVSTKLYSTIFYKQL